MADVVEAMNTIVVALNDEIPCYERWINIVPDCAEHDDFEFIAENEELLTDTIVCFRGTLRNLHITQDNIPNSHWRIQYYNLKSNGS